MLKPNPTPNPQQDMFRSTLENMIDLRDPLCILSYQIDWEGLSQYFQRFYATETKVGRPGEPIRLMVGLLLLKEIEGVSDETVCANWQRIPYYQYFTGEEYFQHRPPVEPPLLSIFRKRIGKEGFERILQETIKIGLQTQVIKPADLKTITVDTTVIEKAIRYPTDVSLCDEARVKIVKLAESLGIVLRQNYNLLSKNACFNWRRMSTARKKDKAKKFAKQVQNYLGRVLRDIGRKIHLIQVTGDKSQAGLLAELTEALRKGWIIYNQFYNREAPERLYSWHAPETECIGKGKARKPFEFGCKVSIVVTNKSNFILSSQALHGRPYDGHTLVGALENVFSMTNTNIGEVHVDRGYRGHKVPAEGVRVIKSGTRSGVTKAIKKRMKRRNAIEPIIGHCKNDRKIGPRNYLRGVVGDQMNALAVAIGFNLRKLLRWLYAAFLFALFLGKIREYYEFVIDKLENTRTNYHRFPQNQ